MQRRLRKACIALKEQSYISYAKIASAAGFSSDMNLIIIKATAPDDFPVHEKYIQHLLKLFSTSPTSCHSFAISFTRRFGTTRCWRVALKSLFLLHRLLRSVQGNSPLWTELLWTRSNGLISLYPCNFNDASASSSSSLSYTNFIISYAHLLDETLNSIIPLEHSITKLDQNPQPHEEKEETFRVGTEMLEVLPQLQSIIDRVMDCYPVGVAKGSFIVQSAMKHIVRDSFICYSKFRREMVVVLDNLLYMPYRNCVAAFNIYKKASLQTNQLYEFYEWCKAKGLCGSYEYPLVEPIPHIQIKALESFLSGMWQLTDHSSNSSSSEKSQSPSPSPPVELFICEGGGDERHHIKDRELFEKPLIELEGDDDDDDSWETVLESSISFSHAYQQSDHLFSSGEHNFDGKWEMANYKSAVSSYNPFSQPTSYYGRIAHNP